MAFFDTVAIVGVGLIGGSIGLALRKSHLARHVIGIGRRLESLRTAENRGAVTEVSTGSCPRTRMRFGSFWE